MKVLVYGYAFLGSDRIRLSTVLLNPVSLLCLYLYRACQVIYLRLARWYLKLTALQYVVSSEPRQLFKKCPGNPPYQINRGIRTNRTKMKVLAYGYAFPGSDRIRLSTVLLNPVSLLCLYLYS